MNKFPTEDMELRGGSHFIRKTNHAAHRRRRMRLYLDYHRPFEKNVSNAQTFEVIVTVK